jgi:ankyrin repeat protein
LKLKNKQIPSDPYSTHPLLEFRDGELEQSSDEDTDDFQDRIRCYLFRLRKNYGKQLLNAPNKDGNTPLHIAYMMQNQTIADILEGSEGVDTSIENNQGDKAVDIKEKISLERFYKLFERRKNMKDKLEMMESSFIKEESKSQYDEDGDEDDGGCGCWRSKSNQNQKKQKDRERREKYALQLFMVLVVVMILGLFLLLTRA